MTTPASLTVDVRDMLCAQALAVVSRGMERVPGEGRIEILCNADDVRRDLLAWARERAYRIEDDGAGVLRLQRAMGRTT